jgi:lantibiotic modifying enzyme
MSNPDALEVAHRTGIRICRDAIRSKDACTWNVPTSARTATGEWHHFPLPAKGSLYQGAAGISLFLAELFARTGDRTLLSVIDGASRHAYRLGAEMAEHEVSFYIGRTGIAYALCRAATLTETEEYAQMAAHLLRPMDGLSPHGLRQDLFAGMSGAIPALLRMGEIPGGRDLARTSVEWGHHLVDVAHPRLTGLAHGAAGYAWAMLELFTHSGDDQFLRSAEEAFAFEQTHFHVVQENWRRLRGGAPDDPFPVGWCHGAPGSVLARLHPAAESRRAEACAGLPVIARALSKADHDFSLCHGAFGRAETLHAAESAFGASQYAERLLAFIDRAVETWALNCDRWPTPARGGLDDPSLMVGGAGVGYFFLRLHAPAVPSVLAHTHVNHSPGGLPCSIQGRDGAFASE